MNMLRTTTMCLCLALPLAAQARPAGPGIQGELHQDLADARRDVRIDLAKAREELQTGNLQLENSLRFASDHGKAASTNLPHAEITPQGDLLIEGKAQQIDAAQREQLLAYRGQIIAIALVGIDIGQKSADAALDAVDGSWVGLLFSAMTGRLERRVERIVNEQVQPAVVDICRQLPAVMDSQQQLASSVPAFRPYANLETDDVEDCENEVREEFASN